MSIKRSYLDFCSTQDIYVDEGNKVQATSLSLEDTPMGRIPTEMFVKILSYLCFEDVLNVKNVCTHFRRVCHQEFKSVARRSEGYSITVTFDQLLLKRIIHLGLSHLITTLHVRECPSNIDAINSMVGQFPNLTDVVLHQKVIAKMKKEEIRMQTRTVGIFVTQRQDYAYDFQDNIHLRRISLVLDHKWRYDPADNTSNKLILMTPIGTIRLRQSRVKSTKELLVEMNQKSIAVSYNVVRYDGGIFPSHKEFYVLKK